MKALKPLGLILILFTVLFANTAMGQGVFTWNGNIDNSWTTAGNWTKTGSVTAETYPGEFNSTNTVTINNNFSNPPVIFSGSYKVARLNIGNDAAANAGATLTINAGATLNVGASAVNNVVLSGGKLINNGTLNISTTATGSSTFLTTGISCATPLVTPPSGTAITYGYTGGANSVLNINLSNAVYLGAAAASVTSTNTDTTYELLFNGSTTITLGTALTYVNATSNPANQVQPTNFFAFRAAGGANASKLIVGGTGFALGSSGSPIVNGGLFSVGAQSTVTVNAGTNLTMHSSSTNVTRGIHFSSAITNVTTFTNKGTINILGSSSTSGILLTTFTAGADLLLDINNEGTLNVDLNCTTVGSAPVATGNGGSTATTTTAFKINNIGTNSILTLKNRATAAGTGAAIFGFVAGQAPPVVITNGGTLNLEGTSYSYGTKFSIVNNSILNSNSELRSFTAITNNVGASINFVKTAATAISRQVQFNGLQATDISGAIGSVYTDGTNNYAVVSQKFASGGSMVANVLSSATIPALGTLTSSSGGTTPVNYTSVSVSSINGALTSTTTNSGTINTDAASNLNIISGVTTTVNSIIAPGGSTGKGIATFSATTQTILGKLNLQVSGDTTAGVDFDQITNTATNGGFDISGAILDITSLYTPANNVAIPIVTASGTGTISGIFASVTGLTSGWTLSYSSTSVNLVYTVAVIPIIWTGEVNNDFFNEANWRDSVTSAVPAANSINPGATINLHLQINSAAATITSGAIQFGTGSLAVGSANLTATSISGGTVTINEGGYVELSAAAPFLNNVQINLISGIGWIRTLNYKASDIASTNIGQIKVNNSTAVYQTNLRLDHYYLNGCVIRANLAATTPLMVYDSANLTGTSAAISVNTLHSGAAIAGTMNNNIESFILKKGFMVTIAIENDGTGKSKNYIASEEDLVINNLPIALQNAVSFIRVIPWNWVNKKGRTDAALDLNTTWRYKWNNNESSTLDWEYAPMAWGWTGSDDNTNPTSLYVGKYNSTHAMSFNEPDNCNGQSGQYVTGYNGLKLCDTDAAVFYHKNLMKTGLRIVSPACTEDASKSNGWLKEFYDKAMAQDVRIDVIGVHWYDWGTYSPTETGVTANQIFNRFKAYITNIHNVYGLPIWITEFQGNTNRSVALNTEFMALALPWLESTDYVERYNWFAFDTNTEFYDSVGGPLNSNGTTYRDQVSNPSVTQDNLIVYNSLTNVARGKTQDLVASSVYSGSAATDVVDGDTSTTTSQWQVQIPTKLPAWLEVDLLGSYTINGFRIIEEIKALKDFTFEVWNTTTSTWNTVVTVTNNPATPLATYKTFTPVSTTKVRLNITAHNSTDFIRMFEFEVYGEPNNPTWTGTTSSVWSLATNWSTGIVPDKYSNVVIPAGTPNQPSITATTTVNSLNIAAGATLTVTSPNFTITASLVNKGTMTLANNSNLIQGGAVNANVGNIIVNRNSNALKRLDYTMWSSPVANQNLLAFSPLTSLTPYIRFYNYDETTNFYSEVASPAVTPFTAAAGYLIRMPNTDPTVGYDGGTATLIYPGVFTGKPNNGTVRLSSLLSDKFYSIGNPYPSTIGANSFLSGNTTGGTLYFWRKTNGVANSTSAYATYTTLGGTAAGNVAPNNIAPNGTIQVGQGFIVKTGPAATSLTFTNVMRTGTTSTPFFKTKQEAEPDRIWLNLTTTTGVFSQTLLGYMDGATLGVDNGIDGKYFNDGPIALTSNIDGEEYTIQGRPAPFDPSDVVALNFKTNIVGDYTIALDHFDGVFANGQDVYLVDSKTGIETDLKLGGYTFNALAVADNSRFSLKYQKTLKVDAPKFNENNVKVYKNNGTIYVKSAEVAINNIKVYDLQGKLIAEQKNVKATTATINNLKAVHQVLIVTVTGEDQSVVAKKVVN
jgi:trimeric autotransporter adhesin